MRRLALSFASAAILATSTIALAPLAHAAGPTLYVGPPNSGPGGCVLPAYASVQLAVDAASPGATVFLCGTTPFAEQVFVNKSLTLTGSKGATIAAPATAAGFAANTSVRYPAQFTSDNLFAPQAIVVLTGTTTHASIKGLTVAGPLPGNGVCGDDEYGVLAIAGSTANVSGTLVKNIHDVNPALYGCQFGVGIQIGRKYWPAADFSGSKVENFVGHGDVAKSTVYGYQKNGITIDGPASSASVHDSVVSGAGRDALFAPTIAQNGVQLSRGAKGSVSENSVSGNSYTGAGLASSGGILVFGGCGDELVTNASISQNTLTNNDVGIFLNNYTSDVNCTVPAATKTADKVSGNVISNDMVSNVSGYCYVNTSGAYTCPSQGYQVGIDDVGNSDVIVNNRISGAGYTYANPPPAFVRCIDTTSVATIDPEMSGNSCP